MSILLRRCATKVVGVVSLVALLAMTIGSVIPSFADTGSIDANDHFTITAAGDATTMDSGDTLVFTIKAYDDTGQTTGQDYTSSNKVDIFIMDPSTWGPSQYVDVTAVNNMTVTDHGALTSESGTLTSGSDISGTSDNAIRVNIADGDGAANTVTVKATGTFQIFVGNPSAAINDSDGTYAG